MQHKTFFSSILLVTAMLLALGEYALYWVDPIGIWGAPVHVGRNHYKTKQESLTEIFKPYEYYRYRPEIIYIGTSKIHRGFEAVDENGKSVYNFGIPGLSLADMKEYLRFAYQIHKPEKVYLGLDFITFSRHIYFKEWNGGRSSFSQKRLRTIAMGAVPEWAYACKDSFSLLQYIPDTLQVSREHREDEPIHDRGWLRLLGKAEDAKPEPYYGAFNIVNLQDRHYKKFQYAPEAMKTLEEILEEAEAAGVEVVLFFAPMNVDEHTSIYLSGHEPQWENIKRDVVRLHPAYDFDFVNDETVNIKSNWGDFVHFNKRLGDRAKQVMQTHQTVGIAYFLTKENVNQVLLEEKAAYEFWRSQNQERVNLLRHYVTSEETAPPGAFREFIGF